MEAGTVHVQYCIYPFLFLAQDLLYQVLDLLWYILDMATEMGCVEGFSALSSPRLSQQVAKMGSVRIPPRLDSASCAMVVSVNGAQAKAGASGSDSVLPMDFQSCQLFGPQPAAECLGPLLCWP